ncbi:MAG: hypothetical protein RI907_3011 [Pseudomonadota bacterium]|jgi:DNA-binding transcriptional MerR regulator
MGASDRTDGVLPPIPDKRYFTIGEVSELCLVKPYVLRYWEQEFVQLKPMKRRGNRRYYQHHEVLLVRRIRELLYDQGFTIHGARNQLADLVLVADKSAGLPEGDDEALSMGQGDSAVAAGPVIERGRKSRAGAGAAGRALQASAPAIVETFRAPDLASLHKLAPDDVQALREALLSIRDLLA